MNGKKLNSAPPVRGSHRFTPNACPTCRGTDPDSDGPGAKTKPCPDSWHETVTGFFEWTGTTWVRTAPPEIPTTQTREPQRANRKEVPDA